MPPLFSLGPNVLRPCYDGISLENRCTALTMRVKDYHFHLAACDFADSLCQDIKKTGLAPLI